MMRMSLLLASAILMIFRGGAPVSGRIENLETVADLITYNQDVNVGFSTPGEGTIQRATGIITRWELPIPIAVDSSIGGTNVAEAMAYWQSVTGVSFVTVGVKAEPRITVRAAPAGELNIAIGTRIRSVTDIAALDENPSGAVRAAPS
jgi:hypothetical protein